MIESFDFGSNWKHYSARALTTSRVEGAREAFCELALGIELESRSFLDVGFGQGLTALCAADAGAAVCKKLETVALYRGLAGIVTLA